MAALQRNVALRLLAEDQPFQISDYCGNDWSLTVGAPPAQIGLKRLTAPADVLGLARLLSRQSQCRYH